jgi:hypothetical protein
MKKGNGKQLSEVGALTYLLIVSCLFFRPTEEIAKRESKQEQRNTRKLRRRSSPQLTHRLYSILQKNPNSDFFQNSHLSILWGTVIGF